MGFTWVKRRKKTLLVIKKHPLMRRYFTLVKDEQLNTQTTEHATREQTGYHVLLVTEFRDVSQSTQCKWLFD